MVYSQSNDLWTVGKHYWNFNISRFSIFVLLSGLPYFGGLISMLTFIGGGRPARCKGVRVPGPTGSTPAGAWCKTWHFRKEIVMAKVICNMVYCKHRSKRPMRTCIKRSGEKCYGCMLDAIDISRIFDPDGDAEMVLGEKEMAHCLYYEPVEEAQDEEE